MYYCPLLLLKHSAKAKQKLKDLEEKVQPSSEKKPLPKRANNLGLVLKCHVLDWATNPILLCTSTSIKQNHRPVITYPSGPHSEPQNCPYRHLK